MARKYDEIKWLAQATAQDLSADTEKWKGLILTSLPMYRKRTGRSSITRSLPQRIYRIFPILERSIAILGILRSMSLKPIRCFTVTYS